MLGGEACTRLPWNISTEPALPVGATMPTPSTGGLGREPRHRFLVERPQRIGRRRLVVTGGEHALLVAFGNDHQRAVDRQNLVEEDGDVHRPRLGHAVVARPGAVILMPLPDVALE